MNTILPTSPLRLENTRSADRCVSHKIYEHLRIAITDILPSILTRILPNALTWSYRTLWSKSVQSHTVAAATLKRTASLFSHSADRLNRNTSAVLLIPGDHAHPLSMLHLADIARAQGKAVFSVHLPYCDKTPDAHRLLLRKSIDAIENFIVQKGGNLSHLLLVGHSRGALEATHEAFVANNPKISAVISIAGRFQVIKPSLRPCRESLEPSVNAVWEKMRNFSPLRVPFYQIAATKDWCIDPEASIIRQDMAHLSVNAGHLGIIHHPDTLRQFKTWIAA